MAITFERRTVAALHDDEVAEASEASALPALVNVQASVVTVT